ncbi:MAG TPA: hypothetical protein VMV49_06160 [Candidatus Deferrimicrobium sp.]|nr:hypothetical protein [Candidatus Deferrimicrobium sp.]
MNKKLILFCFLIISSSSWIVYSNNNCSKADTAVLTDFSISGNIESGINEIIRIANEKLAMKG